MSRWPAPPLPPLLPDHSLAEGPHEGTEEEAWPGAPWHVWCVGPHAGTAPLGAANSGWGNPWLELLQCTG